MTKYSPDHPGQPLPPDDKISRLLRSLANPPSTNASPQTGEFELSEGVVRKALWAWRERSRYLPEALFSDPAWGILLDLLLAELGKRRLTPSRVCKATEQPSTAAVRWLKALEDSNLVIRRVDREGPGTEFIELTPRASAALRCYFRDLGHQR